MNYKQGVEIVISEERLINEISILNDKIEAQDAKIDDLVDENTKLENEKDEVVETLNDTRIEVKRLNRTLEILKLEKNEWIIEIQELDKENIRLKKQLENLLNS